MLTEFTPYPEQFAAHYRAQGYWLDLPLTHAFDRQVEIHPQAIAVIDGQRCFTYEEISLQAASLAHRLGKAGLGLGDRAVVQLPNCAEFISVFYGLLRAGIVPVNAIFTHRGHEMHSYIEQTRPKLLIGDKDHELFATSNFLEQLEQEGLTPPHIILRGADLSDWLQPPTEPSRPFAPTPADEVAFFQLSGGSTGTPKLIPRTHNDYDYSLRASAEICQLSQSTKFLCALPAAHNFTMSSPGILGVLGKGGVVVMAPNPDPAQCFELIAQHKIDLTALVPSAVGLWLTYAKTHGAPRPLRHLLVGGASFASTLARRVPEELGCALQQVFGMAEGLVNYTRLEDDPETIFTTQGRPISPDDELRILDVESGAPLTDGVEGALAVRGPYTIRGYYKAPAHNQTAFDGEGFYFSGDLVIRQPDGNLRVVGRIKDQINRSGEKIAAEEVEALLLRHPDVLACALIGLPDQNSGEKSVAFIVTETPIKASALRRHLRDLGLADYKLPDRFEPIEALPQTPVGKTDKRSLRALLLQKTFGESAKCPTI